MLYLKPIYDEGTVIDILVHAAITIFSIEYNAL